MFRFGPEEFASCNRSSFAKSLSALDAVLILNFDLSVSKHCKTSFICGLSISLAEAMAIVEELSRRRLEAKRLSSVASLSLLSGYVELLLST